MSNISTEEIDKEWRKMTFIYLAKTNFPGNITKKKIAYCVLVVCVCSNIVSNVIQK